MAALKLLILFVLFVIYAAPTDGGWRSGGGRSSSRWGGSGSRSRATSSPYRSYATQRSYATARPTQRSYTNVQATQRSYVNAQPTQRSHATARPTYKSSNIGTTPRYNLQTAAATVRSYQSYNTPRPSYNTPGSSYYSTRRPYYAAARPTYQSSYPRQSYQNTYQQPGFQSRSPYYTPQYSKYPNFYQPTYGKKDHTVRNTVLAGLGGSALGMYLGYKLGSIGNNYGSYGQQYGGYGQPYGQPNGFGQPGGSGQSISGQNPGSYGGFPPYSVVHHYHHGENAIPQSFEVAKNTITTCGNQTGFCTPNTSPLCMTNGTVYCVAPISQTWNCTESKLTNLPCLNTTISVPCLNNTNCTGVMMNETLPIPCVSTIKLFGDFGSNKLEVQHTSDGQNDTEISGQGISSKFCVTIIADPVKIPQNMSNDEFLWYAKDNPDENKKVEEKSYDFLAHVSRFLFD